MIVQGDNGIIVPFTANKGKVIDLTDATVEVSVKRGDDLIKKPTTIIDAANGKCEFSLSNEDLTITGAYLFQWTATFSDGRIFSGKKHDFYVNEKLAGTTVTVTVDGGEF